MKSNLKKKGLLTILGCLMFSIALIFGAMLSGNAKVVFAVESDTQKPVIVSVAGIAIGDSGMGGFPSAIVGEEYKDPDGKQYEVIATGTGPLTYTANEYSTGGYGVMPEGLHLDSTTGKFSGTITSEGEFNVLIQVSNEYGSAQAFCRIKVFKTTDKPTITTESLLNGAVGSYYSQAITYSGYVLNSPTCNVVSGALPTGLSFGIQYGSPTVYGTPTETGTFTFTLSVNNGAGTATKEYSLTITEEAVRPSLINSATIVNASDKYSFIDGGDIHVIKGKAVNIQLVSSGTNTADNPIKYTLDGTLPDGLTLSESGLITGTPANTIETSDGKKNYYNISLTVGNKKTNGDTQSIGTLISIIVHDNGYVERISIDPNDTTVAKAGTRQFNIVWTGYGDIDKDDVTWSFYSGSLPKSSSTTISNTGLLTVGLDETYTGTIWVEVKHNPSGKTTNATFKVVDHTHTTTVVEEKAKTCTEDGNIKHYKCTICNAVFEDVLATKSLTADAVKISAGHNCGDLIDEVPATCSNTGKKAHYKCSVCEKIFTSEMVETTETDLVIAKDETAHKFGTMTSEKPANCAEEGTKAHKTCEYCHKNFENDGTEIADLIIAKNEEHLKQTEWSKDSTGHWHACTRVGCKDGGKLDFSAHNPSATEPTETTDIHCTECGYVIEAETGHIHSFELIAGKAKSCTEDGWKAYYKCSCGNYEDEVETRKITEDIDTWKIIPAGHEFGDWQDEVPATTENTGTKGHKDCSVCHKHFDNLGNEMSDDDLKIAKLTPTEPTEPTPTEPTEPSDKKDNSLSGGAIAGIVVGRVAVAGLGGFALVWFVIKKKKWADLIAVFKKLFKKN